VELGGRKPPGDVVRRRYVVTVVEMKKNPLPFLRSTLPVKFQR